MQAGFTVCEVGRHQIQQVLLIQIGQQGGDIPVQAETQFHRKQSGGAVLRFLDEHGGRHCSLQSLGWGTWQTNDSPPLGSQTWIYQCMKSRVASALHLPWPSM
jgi:hypothetical protein